MARIIQRSELRSQKSAAFAEATARQGGQKSEVGDRMTQIHSAKDLKVYQEAYALAMEIFEISKG